MGTTERQSSSTAPRLVLVADDDDDFRALLAHVLFRAGYEVLTACDGMVALAVFRAHDAAVDAAILDYSMPGMGGEEVLGRLREIRPDLPVILCTGYVGAPAVNRLREAGTPVLMKPFLPKELVTTVAQVLRL